jgi:hypothetical protein
MPATYVHEYIVQYNAVYCILYVQTYTYIKIKILQIFTDLADYKLSVGNVHILKHITQKLY